MTRVQDRLGLAIVVAVVVLMWSATVVQAHDGRLTAPIPTIVESGEPGRPAAADSGPGQTISAAPSAPGVSLTVAVALALGATVVLIRVPRRVVALAIVPLTVLVMFETGVHGVHHLGDPRAAEQCSVAGTAEHVTGTVIPVTAEVISLVLVSGSVALPEAPAHARTQYRAADGRAPPASAA